MARSLRTANYPEERRLALGAAVEAARKQAGFRYRTDMSRAHPEVSVSSLKLVEKGQPVVGAGALAAIASALASHFQDWSTETPKAILEGGEAPRLQRHEPSRITSGVSPVITASPDDPEFWVALRDEVPREKYDSLWELYLQQKRTRSTPGGQA